MIWTKRPKIPALGNLISPEAAKGYMGTLYSVYLTMISSTIILSSAERWGVSSQWCSIDNYGFLLCSHYRNFWSWSFLYWLCNIHKSVNFNACVSNPHSSWKYEMLVSRRVKNASYLLPTTQILMFMSKFKLESTIIMLSFKKIKLDKPKEARWARLVRNKTELVTPHSRTNL